MYKFHLRHIATNVMAVHCFVIQQIFVKSFNVYALFFAIANSSNFIEKV